MKFRLLDRDAKEKVHEGVMPRRIAPEVVAWGSRAFILAGKETGEETIALYREVDAFKIGSFV